ncbi:MAG TPA: 2-C-methyl-D-erythritol 4-phosphate cytidylyltransferase [Candidatus Omnitrophica bacterium]|nr:2-C-methyl-D-erythritol 4-phosphate cytidylyltransferase [Candidatus Omnitrophota bacterium]
MKTTAIIVAAGRSKRLPARRRKPYLMLGKMPIVIHSLYKLSTVRFIRDINLVVNKKDLELAQRLIRKIKIKKNIKIIQGKDTRATSVYEGLKEVSKDSDYVIVHDAGRPFFKKELLKDLIEAAKKYGASILATPVKSTIKKVNKDYIVEKTLDRDQLWEVQTPQVFRKDILLKAYKELTRGKKKATDDASLVERLGVRVKVVPSCDKNIKITTPVDLSLARILLKEKIIYDPALPKTS